MCIRDRYQRRVRGTKNMKRGFKGVGWTSICNRRISSSVYNSFYSMRYYVKKPIIQGKGSAHKKIGPEKLILTPTSTYREQTAKLNEEKEKVIHRSISESLIVGAKKIRYKLSGFFTLVPPFVWIAIVFGATIGAFAYERYKVSIYEHRRKAPERLKAREEHKEDVNRVTDFWVTANVAVVADSEVNKKIQKEKEI
eukprot:TRINITY_DN10698_c0_g2_i1.p1 TRINITY_DN10698_c0_g2~~TRINITY_DN10698_c0_g2_i1.p1  ORF type:complete len:196 (-),score=37.59 TRINITY_DN10698_c0_g2_i1:35-622(-)